MHKGFLFLMTALLSLPACTVGPDYEKPEFSPPETWRTQDASETLGSTDLAWWSGFNDPVLERLIEQALTHNYDLLIATQRVEEFAARLGVTRSQAFPQVSYGASAGIQRSSRETSDATRAPGFDNETEAYTANLNVGWELDLWGRIRRATEQARAQLVAAEENRRGVIVSLVASVANSYVALRSLDTQLQVARQRLESRAENVRLFERQLEQGMISALELAQVRTEYERTAATIPQIRQDIATTENNLSVLLGVAPGPIMRGTDVEHLTMPSIPPDLPSQILEQRPDVKAAEQQLVAANAAIGVAEAAWYPTISLTGNLGLASDDLSNLISSDAILYQLAAEAAGPIFTGGQISSQIEAARAQQKQALYTYYNTLLSALLEVDNALVTHATTREQNEVQARQVKVLRTYTELARKRYDNGYVSYLEVLDAERDLFDAELEQIRLNAALYASLIDIYKTFGGGWIDQADVLSAQSNQAPDDSTPLDPTPESSESSESSQ